MSQRDYVYAMKPDDRITVMREALKKAHECLNSRVIGGELSAGHHETSAEGWQKWMARRWDTVIAIGRALAIAAEAEPSPSAVPIAPQEAELLVSFIQKKRDEAERSRLARIDEAASWRCGTDADHKSSHAMAERMSGRKMPFHSSSEREEIAARAERIAQKYAEEVRLFDAALSVLEAAARLPAEARDAVTFSTMTAPAGPGMSSGCGTLETYKEYYSAEARPSPTEPKDGDLLRELGMDGHKWAAAFMQQHGGKKLSTLKGKSATPDNGLVDEGDMIAWFCNAIMAGYDEATRRAASPSPIDPPSQEEA